MKTLLLIAGLVQVALGACGFAAFGLYESPVLTGVVLAGAAINCVMGTQNVMEACFGKGGLVCDLFARRIDATNE